MRHIMKNRTGAESTQGAMRQCVSSHGGYRGYDARTNAELRADEHRGSAPGAEAPAEMSTNVLRNLTPRERAQQRVDLAKAEHTASAEAIIRRDLNAAQRADTAVIELLDARAALRGVDDRAVAPSSARLCAAIRARGAKADG